MFYDIPATMKKEEAPQWPEGVGSIQATLPDGMAVEVPVLKGTNVLTLGVVGTGKTKSFTENAADILLSGDPDIKGVFFEVKHSFMDRFLVNNDKVLTYDSEAIPEKNLFVPNMIKEIRQANDSEAEMRELADFLFAELLNGANQNRAWIQAARNTFIGILRTIVDCFPGENTGNGTLIHALRRMTTGEILA